MMSKRWTVMLYLAGDNNLQEFAERDLGELKMIGSTGQVNFVAQLDRMGDRSTRRYYLTAEHSLAQDVVATLDETNTGEPQSLVDFVGWACTEYPAEHIALILWNHGLGWKDDDIYAAQMPNTSPEPRSLVRGIRSQQIGRALFASSIRHALAYPAPVRGILFDDTSCDFLDNQELALALDEILARRGAKIDLIGFDACLMNMIEVASQVESAAHIMVGSQEIEPGNGWTYNEIARTLTAAPDTSPEQLAASIVNHYASFYRRHPAGYAVTQAALRLSYASDLVQAVSEFADLLRDRLVDRVFTSRTLLPALREVQKFRDAQYADLYHFSERIAAHTDDQETRSGTQDILERLTTGSDTSVVIAESKVGESAANAHGLSIYLPIRGTVSPAYSALKFARRSSWANFIAGFSKL